MDPQPVGNDYRQFNLTYEAVKLPYVVSSTIKQGAYLHQDNIPATITLLMSDEISQSLEDGAFTWRLSTGTEEVLASAVTFDGTYITFDLPDLSSYEGTVVLTGVGLTSLEGVELKTPISISFEVGNSQIYPTTEKPETYTEDPDTRQGDLRVSRLIVPNGAGAPEVMISAFKAQLNLTDSEILQIVHRGGEGTGYTDVFIAWFKELAPRPVVISPTPHTTLSSENPPTEIIMSFDDPVENMTDSDVVVSGSLSSYTVSQLSDDKKLWKVGLVGVAAGQIVLKMVVPDSGGGRLSIPRMYAWQIISRSIASASGGIDAFCDNFTGDGVTTIFTISYSVIACSWHVYVNGIAQMACVSVTGTSLIFLTAPFVGAQIMFRAWRSI